MQCARTVMRHSKWPRSSIVWSSWGRLFHPRMALPGMPRTALRARRVRSLVGPQRPSGIILRRSPAVHNSASGVTVKLTISQMLAESSGTSPMAHFTRSKTVTPILTAIAFGTWPTPSQASTAPVASTRCAQLCASACTTMSKLRRPIGAGVWLTTPRRPSRRCLAPLVPWRTAAAAQRTGTASRAWSSRLRMKRLFARLC
mmetsp:Transcript_30798/g.89477  ORF Transcript_30798/g.89477 Transcript_30798/m.89477 type:complete len:201 (+) Transcript_30798:410-1012(+)